MFENNVSGNSPILCNYRYFVKGKLVCFTQLVNFVSFSLQYFYYNTVERFIAEQ